MRLDLYLYKYGYALTRTEAKNYIQSGAVSVNGKIETKPSYDIPEDIQGISIQIDKESKKYVSRGGYKLEAALDSFKIDPKGLNALDVGASSGGFTDCLLQRGVKHVIAVDSGHSQLSHSLLCDSRVTSKEKFNARFMTKDMLEYEPDIAVMDVSFISSTHIIPAVFNCLREGGIYILLVKPQFEVGKQNIGKGGIVKDEKCRYNALKNVIDFAINVGFNYINSIESPIKGGDGNIEYLVCFKK